MATIPTEPIGSLPRPDALLSALRSTKTSDAEREQRIDESVQSAIEGLISAGSPVITDGEQGKFPDFMSYPLNYGGGFQGTGSTPPLADSKYILPQLADGRFRYVGHADQHIQRARRHTELPIKQAVISPSLLSLLYPATSLPNYSRDAFVEDLLTEHVTEIRHCIDQGAYRVQIDFVDSRLATWLDSSGQLLNSFIILLSLALDCFTAEEQARIGIYVGTAPYWTGPNSIDIDDTAVLSTLLEFPIGSFYIPFMNRAEPERLLKFLRTNLKKTQRVFIGTTDPTSPEIETPEQVCKTVMQAARYIPPEQLGTTDDCGFAPFADKAYADRQTALAKIRARIEGTEMATRTLNGN